MPASYGGRISLSTEGWCGGKRGDKVGGSIPYGMVLEERGWMVLFGYKQRKATWTGGTWTSAGEAQLRLFPRPSRPTTHMGQPLLKDLGSQDGDRKTTSPPSFRVSLTCSPWPFPDPEKLTSASQHLGYGEVTLQSFLGFALPKKQTPDCKLSGS